MEQKSNIELTTFLDSFQRTVIGEKTESVSEDILTVKNPVVVNVIPQIDPRTQQPTGQMALQLLPLFFREFLGDKSEPVFLDYNKKSITPIRFAGGFDWRLYGQYQSMFLPPQQQTNAPQGVTPPKADEKIINLFPN